MREDKLMRNRGKELMENLLLLKKYKAVNKI